MKTDRKAGHKISPLILNRWSPRAMTGEEIPDEELMTLFEAARWAPSSFNNQPWRFIYTKINSESWDRFFNLLGERNQAWVKNAGALVVVISRKNFEHNNKPSITHQFDSGSAWENLALQASSMDIVAHGMEGFDYDKARKDLEVPADYDVMAMVAIGKLAPKDILPEEMQQMEAPSDRKPVKEIIMEGKFRKS